MIVSFPLTIDGFGENSTWSNLNGDYTKRFEWSQILRAAIMAGYPTLTTIPSYRFRAWRFAAIRLALRHENRVLIQPPEANRFDPAEQAALSSLLGITITKLLVEEILHAPILLFLDVHFDLTFPAPRETMRPDFAAQNLAGQWFSVESKGMTRFRRATLAKGLKQARKLGMVDGQTIQKSVVCLTSFTGGRMKARFVDPPIPRRKFVSARLKSRSALALYYQYFDRFYETASPSEPIMLGGYRTPVPMRKLEDLDAEIGMLPELRESLTDNSEDRSLTVLKEINDKIVGPDAPELGPDGIVVVPGKSWINQR